MAPATDNHSDVAGSVRVPEIRDLVDDSSLGNQGARDLRARTIRSDIAAVLNRSGVFDERGASPDYPGTPAPTPAVGSVGSPTSSTDAGRFGMRTGLGSPRDPSSEPRDLIRSVSRGFQVLEAVGQSPRGLTVKQIARRCELTVTSTYHLVRTLAYEGYLNRREDGTYIVGLEVADRFRELVLAYRGPQEISTILRTAAAETGHTFLLARFVHGRVAVIAIEEGIRSPRCEDLVVGFDDAAHATAAGKALLASLNPDQRWRFFKEVGLPALTPRTLTSPEVLDEDLSTGNSRGLYTDTEEFHLGLSSAGILAVTDREAERRLAVACTVPPEDLAVSAESIRSRLLAVARSVASAVLEASND